MVLIGDGGAQLELVTQILGVSQSDIRSCDRLVRTFIRLPQASENHAKNLFRASESKLREEDLW